MNGSVTNFMSQHSVWLMTLSDIRLHLQRQAEQHQRLAQRLLSLFGLAIAACSSPQWPCMAGSDSSQTDVAQPTGRGAAGTFGLGDALCGWGALPRGCICIHYRRAREHDLQSTLRAGQVTTSQKRQRSHYSIAQSINYEYMSKKEPLKRPPFEIQKFSSILVYPISY
eukprot:CAMPEP_0201092330 /NCGR_PEP_ID=MMETSP0812-20130820/938_1 /ASSEMBLY_ACC=CAM_ASM_000668 /TAXON_ID=98059 /ORGANISM="Dinobryon sp., Strain UTEXLB2267" /LENGTH=167 /DNA_ID=CAMNT_0047343889 /DNA_START=168 /DNA_END=672 /DNA_ORIENTATION=+